MKNIKRYLQDSLLEDLSFLYNDVNENGGLYEGQTKLAGWLTDEIINLKKSSKLEFEYDELKDIAKNIICNKLILNIVLTTNIDISADFKIQENPNSKDIYIRYNWDNKNKRINSILINVYCPKDNIEKYQNNIKGRISHELNHIWTYWNILRDDFNESDEIPKDYDNKLHKWNKDIYTNIIKYNNSKNGYN